MAKETDIKKVIEEHKVTIETKQNEVDDLSAKMEREKQTRDKAHLSWKEARDQYLTAYEELKELIRLQNKK